MGSSQDADCATILASGAAFVAGVVFLVSSIASLAVISFTRAGKKSDGMLYFAEAIDWISLMFAAVLMSYSALDLPKIVHTWRVSRCA